jgi:hypothetical protein
LCRPKANSPAAAMEMAPSFKKDVTGIRGIL